MQGDQLRPLQTSRRTALKTLGAGIVGSVGIGAASQSAAATQTQWSNYDEYHDDYENGYDTLGAGLTVTSESITDSGHYETNWELSGNGVVMDENGDFPVPEEDYDDTYPRKIPEEHPLGVVYQGLTIEVTGDISVDIDRGDGDDKYLYPEGGDEGNTVPGDVVMTAAGIAADALGADDKIGYALDGAELASSLLGFVNDDSSGRTYDLTQSYTDTNEEFFRGGFGFEDLIIIADAGDYGTVDITYEWGRAQTGFEVYVQYDGRAYYYDVTKK